MTYHEWEGELLRYLKSLPESELEKIKEYYREMHGDRTDAGMNDSEILAEFGEAKVCAAKILQENTDSEGENPTENTEKSDTVPPVKHKTDFKEMLNSLSVSKIVGWFFLGIFVLIPSAAIAISVVVSFAAATIGCGAGSVGGLVIALISPFISGPAMGAANAIATVGAGLAASGICALLTIAFYYLTKYSVFVCIKLAKYVFGGKKNEKTS